MPPLLEQEPPSPVVPAGASSYKVPAAAEFAAATRRRSRRIVGFCLASALLVVGFLGGMGLDNPVLPLAFILVIATPVLLWHFPRLTAFVTLAGACLFEVFPLGFRDDVTGLVPLFWNVNSIFQRYGRMNVKAVPLNLLEIILLTGGACSLVRAVYSRRVRLAGGPLFGPIVAYIGFVIVAWAIGLSTGGDINIAFQEVRSQFYFLLAYLIGINLIKDRNQWGPVLWTAVACIGLKAVLYVYRYLVTLHGVSISDQGVGSHEEAFFFNVFIFLLPILMLFGAQPKLRRLMWILLPVVIAANIACNRRAGTAAAAVALPILILAAHRALPEKRRIIKRTATGFLLVFALYFPLFMNSNNFLAEPARALKSEFAPDTRDAGSNAYRDAENADLMATIKLAPIQGFGYGKRMMHAVPIADISSGYEYWDVITHNNILWVWMRVGTVGFAVFWIMVSSIVIYQCKLLRTTSLDPAQHVLGLLAITTYSMLLVFGLVDLGLSCYREVLFAGLLIGLSSGVQALPHRPVE